MLKEKRFCKILKKILEDFEPKATPKNIEAMKKKYMKPEQRVVQLQHRTHLLSGSVRGITNNAGLNSSIGSGNGDARSRSSDDDWDDWDE